MGQEDNLTLRPVSDAAAMLGIMDRRPSDKQQTFLPPIPAARGSSRSPA